MNNSRFRHHKTLLLLCLLVAAASGCSSLNRLAQSSSWKAWKAQAPARGLRVTKIIPGGHAERFGVTLRDILFRYGDFEIIDDASFFAARDFYEKKQAASVSILVWRGASAVEVMVPPGKLGVESDEYGPVAGQFATLIEKLEVMERIPEYLRGVEFKNDFTPPEKIREQATQVLDRAEREGTLTPNQILVRRIYLIGDDAPAEQIQRQSDLLAQLIATQPVSYVQRLGNDDFFEKQHYRPATACYERYLKDFPDDVNMRLDMGIAYSRLGMLAEAEAAADYVFSHRLRLTSHGLFVACDIKAMAALGRGDYNASIDFAEKAAKLEPGVFHFFLVMLAAAKAGDMEKAKEASERMERMLPQEFKQNQLQIAAVEALALVKNNKRNQARIIVNKWKETDRAEGRIKSWWKVYPDGAAVLNNWSELARG